MNLDVGISLVNRTTNANSVKLRKWHALAAAVFAGLLGSASLAQTPNTAPKPASPAPIEQLSTNFSSPAALDGWQEHRVDGFTAKWQKPTIEKGALVLRPMSSGWFEDMQGGHLYRTIEGNFIVTAKLKVEGTKANLPQTLFSLAGVFIRAPRDGMTAANWQPKKENWMFFSMGSAFPAGKPQFEIKTTYNSLSTLKIYDAKRAYTPRAKWVDLRVARQGELFSLLYRIEGDKEFQLLDQFIRPDLPTTLNVGVTAYADWESAAKIYPDFVRLNTEAPAQNADLVAYVSRIDFRRPTVDRFPVATLDPAVSFMPDVSKQRLVDLTQR